MWRTRMRARRRRRDSDAGFTLIELIMAIAIGSIIALGIGEALTVGFTTTDSTQLRLKESHDAEYSARWFSGDAASTDLTHFSVSQFGGLACTDGTFGTRNVVTFGWTPVGASVATIYEWVRQGDTLVRISCSGHSYTGELIMSSNLAAGVPPTVTCTPTHGSHHGHPCTGSQLDTITMTVTEAADPHNPGSPYTYTLTGTPRGSATTGDAQPATDTAPLVLLGHSGTVLTLSGSGSLTVNGTAESLGGKCEENGEGGHGGHGGRGGGGSSCPNLRHATSDPLSVLPVPSTSGLPVYHSGFFDHGAISDHGCGVYDGILTLSGHGNHRLNSAGQPDCVYYLREGMSVSGGATVTMSSAGALIYLAGGYQSGFGHDVTYTAFDCSGSALCDLTPIADENSVYHNVAIFASPDLKPSHWPDQLYDLDIQGSSASTYHGLIYAPVENVNTDGNANVVAAGVISYSMTVAGSGGTTVGCPSSGC